MKKHILSIVLATTMVAIMLGGCGTSAGDNGAKNENSITVLVESGSPAEALANDTAAAFEEETGCKVIVDAVAYSGMYDKLSTEIKAGSSAHDVACMDFVWLASFADGIEPLAGADTNDFLPTLEESGTVNGNLLGYPMWVNTKILIYRKDLIPEDKVPTTWEEYRSLAEEIATPEMYGTTVFGSGSDAVCSFLDFVCQAGAEGLVFDKDGNGKTGIHIASAQDAFRITGMGFVYLEHGITIYHADALSIHDNFIAECGNCIELRGWGQASKITDNFIGAGYKGYSIFAQNFGGLLINANNIFPRGTSSVHFDHVARSIITGNRFHSFYPGMLVFEGKCSENMVSSNHFLRDNEPWAPLLGYDNGLNDSYGLLHINGNNNTIMGNHISETIAITSIKPLGEKPVIIHIVSGKGNYISDNHIVATTEDEDVQKEASDSCFSAQVNALTSTDRQIALDVTTVWVEKEAIQNMIFDSGSDEQVVLDKRVNAFRATPVVGDSN